MSHFFPSYSTQKDSSNDNFLDQKIKFLKNNSQWVAKGASIGTLVDSSIYVKKTKGIQKFIFFHQNKDSSFVFPLIEAISLVFSKKMIILSLSKEGNIFAPSCHSLIEYLIRTQKITFKEIKFYSLFTRLSATSRKPAIEQEKKSKDRHFKEGGYSSMIQNERINGPKDSESFRFNDVFPISQLVKFPSNYKFPPNFAFHLPNVKSTVELNNDYVCVPINFNCLVKISKPRNINYSAMDFE